MSMKSVPMVMKSVTLCICTCRRTAMLSRLLDRLARVAAADRVRAAVRILVVDNAPTGEVSALCREGATRGWPIDCVEEPKRGLCHARNRAVLAALEQKPDFIAFLDDDDLPRLDWLQRLLARQEETDADIVSGRWELDRSGPGSTDYVDLYRDANAEKKGKSDLYGTPRGCGTNNLMFRREVIEAMSVDGELPFSLDLEFSGCEDNDFLIRAVRRGFSIVRCEESVVLRGVEPQRQSFRGQLRRGFKNGSAQMTLCRLHGSAAQRWRLVAGAVVKLTWVVATLPLAVASRNLARKQVYRLAKLAGLLRSAGLRSDFSSSYYRGGGYGGAECVATSGASAQAGERLRRRL